LLGFSFWTVLLFTLMNYIYKFIIWFLISSFIVFFHIIIENYIEKCIRINILKKTKHYNKEKYKKNIKIVRTMLEKDNN